MTDPMKQAWSNVEERVSALGRLVKERYRDANDDDGADEGTRHSGDELKRAFDSLVAAVREVGDRAADVARDEDVKAQARQAAASLNDALSATVAMIGEQLGGLLKRSGQRGPTSSDTPTEVPAGGGDDPGARSG